MLHVHISNGPEARFTILQFKSDFSPSLAILQTARQLWQLFEATYLAQEPAQGRPSEVQNLARLADGQVHASEKKKRCSKLSLKQTFLHLSTLQSGRHLFNGNTPLPRSLMPRRKLHTLVSRGKTHYLSDCQGTQHCPGPRKEAEGMDMSHGNYVTNPEETLLMWAGGFF